MNSSINAKLYSTLVNHFTIPNGDEFHPQTAAVAEGLYHVFQPFKINSKYLWGEAAFMETRNRSWTQPVLYTLH